MSRVQSAVDLPVQVLSVSNGSLVSRLAELLRLSRAALICQKQYRMVRDRRAFLRVRRAVVTIQAFARGVFTRRIYWEVRDQPDPVWV